MEDERWKESRKEEEEEEEKFNVKNGLNFILPENENMTRLTSSSSTIYMAPMAPEIEGEGEEEEK